MMDGAFFAAAVGSLTLIFHKASCAFAANGEHRVVVFFILFFPSGPIPTPPSLQLASPDRWRLCVNIKINVLGPFCAPGKRGGRKNIPNGYCSCSFFLEVAAEQIGFSVLSLCWWGGNKSLCARARLLQVHAHVTRRIINLPPSMKRHKRQTRGR